MCKDHGTDTSSPFICRHDVIRAVAIAGFITWAAPQYWPWSFGTTITAIITIIIGLFAIMIVRTITMKSSAQLTAADKTRIAARVDKDAADRLMTDKLVLAERLAAAIRIPTISWDYDDKEHKIDYDQTLAMHSLLQKTFPLVHQHLELTVINKYSLLYCWKGSQHATQKAYLLTAHLDVVPTPDLDKWENDPFSGLVANGFVHGRGTIDDKHCVMGILESVEDLLRSGFKPQRTVYLAFGHDEEIGGRNGAQHIARHLQEQKAKFEFMLDEGLFIIDGVIPGHRAPVAMVCVAEKGSVSVELTVQMDAGHSSAPPASTAIGVLATAVSKLEKNPHPAYFNGGPTEVMFSALATGFKPAMRLVMSNLWLTAPLVKRLMISKPATATALRTTTALTVFKSGTKVNVLPLRAQAYVNHRIHPLDTIDKVVERDRRIINDKRVKLAPVDSSIEPSPVSDHKSASFRALHETVAEIFPHVAVAPALFVANSDTRWYWDIVSHIYRFSPTELHASQLNMFHGINEKIAIDNYVRIVLFYRALIRNTDARNVAI